MSITVVRLGYSDTAGAGTSTALTVPIAQPIGTHLVVKLGGSGGGSTFGVTDTKGNTWTQRQYASQSTSPSALAAIWTTELTVALTTSDVITFTSTSGSGAGDMILEKLVPDVGATLAYHNGSTGIGDSNAPAVASYTPGANSVTLTAMCSSSALLNSQTTAGSGFTKVAGGDAHVRTRAVVGQYGYPTAATTTPMGFSISNTWAMASVTMTQTTAPTAVDPTEFAGGVVNTTTSKTRVMSVTAAVPIGAKAILHVMVPGSTANTLAGTTISDTKGNTWTKRELVVQVTAAANGQLFEFESDITVALTTSDTVTVVVDNTGSIVWAWEGIQIPSGVTTYDVGAVNTGATNQTMDTGTTAAAAQNIQLAVIGFVYQGTNVTPLNLPSQYTLMTIRRTTGTVRNLAVAWGYLNAAGTRHATATMSDSTNHPWAGMIHAWNSIAPPPADSFAFLPDSLGTGFVNAELVMAVGSGWDS